MLTTLPAKLVVSPEELLALEHWIDRGNTLLILAALDDTPGWTQGDDLDLPMLEDWLHIHFSSRHSGDDDGTLRESVTSLFRTGEIQLEPLGGHPLLQGIHQISVTSELPASHWVGAARDYATLAVARRRDDGNAALWLQARESGQILLCALAAPFSNAQITRADNARLLANIIAWSRARDGRVLFDDVHQGLVSFYDPHAFYADPRLHRSLGWMLALWLLWVLGSQPLRVQQQPWMPIDETQLIDAGGRFFSRHVPAAAAARALLENFFDELRHRMHQNQDGTPPWEWLAVQPRITPENLQALQRHWQRASAGEKVDLASLQNLLVALRESLE